MLICYYRLHNDWLNNYFDSLSIKGEIRSYSEPRFYVFHRVDRKDKTGKHAVAIIVRENLLY